MAGAGEVIGGEFLVKFGSQIIRATACTTKIRPVVYTEQVSSDGVVMTSAKRGASTAEMTILISSITSEQAILDFFGTISIRQLGTQKTEKLYLARVTGGINHNHEDGTATISIIAADGEVVK